VTRLLAIGSAAGPWPILAGCGGSSGSGSSTSSGDWIRPVGAYVAPGCSDAAEKRGPQYVVVASYVGGRLTGNTGSFTGVPECGNVIVYVEADKGDELRIPKLRIAATVKAGETGTLEFYAPSGTYEVVLERAKVQIVKVVVD